MTTPRISQYPDYFFFDQQTWRIKKITLQTLITYFFQIPCGIGCQVFLPSVVEPSRIAFRPCLNDMVKQITFLVYTYLLYPRAWQVWNSHVGMDGPSSLLWLSQFFLTCILPDFELCRRPWNWNSADSKQATYVDLDCLQFINDDTQTLLNLQSIERF